MAILWKTSFPANHSVSPEESQAMGECPVKFSKEELSKTRRSIKARDI